MSDSGETSILKKSEIDNDSKFGCLAYGTYPKKEDENKE